MSLLLRNKLRVVLCRDQLSLTVTARGWRQPAAAPIVLSCKAADGAAEWAPALAALDSWLAGNKMAATVEFILSDRLVRYAMMPWSAEITSEAERGAMAQIHFQSLYGATAGAWEIQMSPAGYEQARLACAIDPQLLHALRALVSTHKLRLASLRPYLMNVVKQWRKQMTGDALLAVMESDQCTMAGFKNGGWCSVRGIRLQTHAATDMGLLIERELVLQGLEGATVYLHAPGLAPAVQLRGGGAVVVLANVAGGVAQAPSMVMSTCAM
ncbi:hypothetical protein O0880_10650 [Janthinobacterium sp. SUN118]|uniref:hypothetical protein n=1 Tax=Janthinobacterium sp. SUN118 TaxID=3004100 RepID=UPI0025AFA2BF|nr:hypothetical protein [Janthinobacterium sp. SUN118]MDN2709872.1 hypothetical protein [Janthinobacterium sp. SUN118]